MEIEKRFTGTVTTLTNESIIASYGTTATVVTNKEKTKVLVDAILDLLNGTGIDFRYEKPYIWLEGFPFSVYIASNNYLHFMGPFDTTSFASATSSPFSGSAYDFKVRVCGYPNSGLVIQFTSYGAATYQSIYGFKLLSAHHVVTREPIKVYGSLGTYTLGIGFNSDGTPKAIGRNYQNRGSSASFQLSLNAGDYLEPNKLPLVKQVDQFVEFDHGFMFPLNSGLNNAPGTTAPIQSIQIGGKEFILGAVMFGVGLLEKPT